MADQQADKPPLGDFLAKYRQYKDYTLTLSSWLAENALKCGFDDIKPGAAAPSAPKAGGGRLKGKDRKKAKEAATKSPSAAAPSGPQYIIQVSQFVPMAQAIAAYKPKPNVPPALSRLFDRVIEARRQFASWYAGMKATGPHLASNERHNHFIDVLQATWEVLVPFVEARKTSKPSPKTEDQSRNKSGLLSSLENRFANLHVESPSDSFGAHAASIPPSAEEESPKLSPNINVQIQRDEDELEQDFFLAIYTFLNELNDAQGYIESAWEDVATESDELAQAALQSNLIIQLVRRAESSLENFVERPKRFPASIYPTWTFPFILLFKIMGFLEQEIVERLPPKARLDNITKPDFEILTDKGIGTFDKAGEWADFCFAKPFIVFHYAIHKSKPTPGGGTSLGALNADQWCSNDELEIFQTFNRIQAVALTANNDMAEDEVTRGVRVATETKTVPIWAVFGFQCLLDINHLFKTNKATMFGDPMLELHKHVSMAIKNLNDIDIERLKPPIRPTPPHVQDLIQLIGNIEDEVLNGSLTEQVTKINSGLLPSYLEDPDFFLEYNPIRCGLMLYNLRLQLYDRALTFDKGLLMLIPMVHLYKMCRLVYPEMPAWPDMEFFLLHQDVERLFIGGLPVSLTESTSKYALAIGMSAQALSKMKRTGKMKPPNFDKMRFAQNTCPIGSILVSSLGGYAKDEDMVLLELLRWLNDPKKMDLADSLLDRQSRPPAEASEKDDTLFRTAQGVKQKMRQEFSFSHASISNTLAFSDVFIQSERDVLNFDWVEFMHTANEMATHFSSILGRYYPEEYKETNGLFCGMLTKLMAEAEGAERRANTKGRNPATLAELAPPALKDIRDAMQARGLASRPHDKRELDTKYGKQEAVWWNMDRGIASVIRRYSYSLMSRLTSSEQFLRDCLYHNWPVEDLERSYAIQTVRAFDGLADYVGIDKEWDECEVASDDGLDLDIDDDDDEGEEDGSDGPLMARGFNPETFVRERIVEFIRSKGGGESGQYVDLLTSRVMQRMPPGSIDALARPHTAEFRNSMAGVLAGSLADVLEAGVEAYN
ncbi:hypothetical protein PG993_000266 [Apiospora rasikravindrae]|uniref:DUF6604 domain-containing protein n=1 Tax=Apiospora rasikravindrae TaxID=990691 RepID=A0ABR1UAU7_9PEZI